MRGDILSLRSLGAIVSRGYICLGNGSDIYIIRNTRISSYIRVSFLVEEVEEGADPLPLIPMKFIV